ncbi:hypothetical protein PILCRDRAFT_93899, partial [Piloderma croceum F 1598]
MSESKIVSIWCLVDSELKPFSVLANVDDNIDELVRAIRLEKPALREFGTPNLVLWKLDDPIPIRPALDLAKRIQSPFTDFAEVLEEPTLQVSEVFTQSPSKDHLYIIVKRSAGEPSTTEPTFDIEVIDKEIEKELKSLRGVVETFLKSPEPPTWVPPDYVTPSNREFLTNLRIPCYRNGNPSLLFHDLDVCDDNEIEKIFERGAPLCICNTSGSGKTRRLMEGLTKYWGFYLVAIPDVNGVGVRDMQDALDEVASYREWKSDLRLLSSEQRADQSQLNSRIASKHLRQVLAARIVVFQLFLQLAILVDGNLQEKHKRIWLLFQLSDQLGTHNALHPFVRIIRNCLRQASDAVLDKLVERLNPIREKYLPYNSRFIFGLDEAQRATRLYPYSFVSSNNDGVFRSIIREICKVFTKSPIKLVVS